MSMSGLKLSTKMWGGFAVVLILLCIMGYIGVSRMTQLMKESEDVAKVRIPQLVWINKIVGDYDRMAVAVRNLPLTSDAAINSREKATYTKAKEEMFQKDLPGLEKLLTSEKGKQLFASIKANLGELSHLSDSAVELGATDRDKEAADLIIHDVTTLTEKFYASLNAFEEFQVKLAEDDGAEAVQSASVGRSMMLILAAVALACGVLIAFFLIRHITKPLNRVIAGLSDGSEQVASASLQVSVASQSLAEGASEQAAGIEETSSSIEEMASMTKQNADNAGQANSLMTETSRVVNDANRSMSELTESMRDISTASEETAKIIKTIDEIAFQTNLLALNAAVEAARAGEAGAGFAVVADEVRNLAMRAAEAAKNTANLIEGTVKKIRNGSDTVAKTNEAFSKVATGAKKVGELVGEIAAASNEQAQGVDQINKAVSEMDKVVQKNAASAEESASAAEEMNAQAEMMKEFVVELTTVVGGSGNGNGAASVKSAAPAGRISAHASTINHRGAGVPKALPAAKKEKVKGAGSDVHKAGKARPDQVIPMEEGDFKQF